MQHMDTGGDRPIDRSQDEAERRPDITESARASNAERNVVAEQLRDAYADGRLDEDEFDVRIHEALVARTRADLEHLLADLEPGVALAGPANPSTAARHDLPARSYPVTIAIMSGNERRGRFSLPADSTAFALMGGIELDLRAATLSSPVTTIRAVAIMGGIDIVVPPGIRVEMTGLPIMGGAEDKVDDADLPSTAPMLRVQYLAIMGGVTVKTREPRADRRQLRDRPHRELRHGPDE